MSKYRKFFRNDWNSKYVHRAMSAQIDQMQQRPSPPPQLPVLFVSIYDRNENHGGPSYYVLLPR